MHQINGSCRESREHHLRASCASPLLCRGCCLHCFHFPCPCTTSAAVAVPVGGVFTAAVVVVLFVLFVVTLRFWMPCATRDSVPLRLSFCSMAICSVPQLPATSQASSWPLVSGKKVANVKAYVAARNENQSANGRMS